MRLFLTMACLVWLILAGSKITVAQTPAAYQIEPNGEAAVVILTDVNRQAEKMDKPVILVARLGEGETLRRLNLRRLHNVAARLYSVKSIIKTEGDKIGGKGHVEIYLDGQLNAILLAHRNKDLAVDCCEEFKDLYPWYNPAKDQGKHLAQKSAEKLTENSPKVAYAVPDNSEFTGALMAQLNHKIKQSPHKLILVSRLGDGERLSYLHVLRLRAIESVLYGETPEKWILTRGEKVKGLGRVECYVNGDRELTLMTEHNEEFIMGCCELADGDPRWARARYKRKLRLAREISLVKKLHKNNR